MNTPEIFPLAAPTTPSEHITPRREFLVQAASMLGLTVSAGAALTLVNACETTVIKPVTTTGGTGTTTGGTGTTTGGTGTTTPENVINIAQEAALQSTGGAIIKTISGTAVVIMRTNDTDFLVLSATCTHEGCRVELPSRGIINCFCHGSQFSASTGNVITGPAVGKLRSYTAAFDKAANTLTITV